MKSDIKTGQRGTNKWKVFSVVDLWRLIRSRLCMTKFFASGLLLLLQQRFPKFLQGRCNPGSHPNCRVLRSWWISRPHTNHRIEGNYKLNTSPKFNQIWSTFKTQFFTFPTWTIHTIDNHTQSEFEPCELVRALIFSISSAFSLCKCALETAKTQSRTLSARLCRLCCYWCSTMWNGLFNGMSYDLLNDVSNDIK